jgi:3-hydroxyisobutyrate dehydrogenase
MKIKNRIGIIGIGAMGMAIAKNLQRKGFDVVVRDICGQAEQAALAAGMTVAVSPAVLMAQVDLVIVIVVNAQQIKDVLFGPDSVTQMSVTQTAASGKVVMLCSTIGPDDAIECAQRLAPFGIAMIDAPVSGGPARAEAGAMSMMLAASDALLDDCETVLTALSDKRFRISATIGDGAKAKLVNNLLAGINLVAGAEALALGTQLGLDRHKLFDLICASSGHSWVFEDRMARALQDDFAPRAAAHILTKDVTLATAMADAAGYDTPLGDAALAVFRQTIADGNGAFDDAVVIRHYLEKDASDDQR